MKQAEPGAAIVLLPMTLKAVFDVPAEAMRGEVVGDAG
jgi:hypothetical protein